MLFSKEGAEISDKGLLIAGYEGSLEVSGRVQCVVGLENTKLQG